MAAQRYCLPLRFAKRTTFRNFKTHRKCYPLRGFSVQLFLKNMKRFLLLASALVLTFTACNKDEGPSVNQAEVDREIIQQYLADNNLTATEHPSGLFYIIDQPGSGGNPKLNNDVTVEYKGYLTNGSVFDETQAGKPRSFALSGLIPGWQIGIPLLQKGGEGRFFIPSALGYGSRALPGIPANSVLVFEIKLVDYN